MSATEIDQRRVSPFPLFASGFRCFFLGAALLAFAMVVIWFLFYSGQAVVRFYYFPPVIWHQHEMVFGYSGAVIAGFLLTAVSNWTGQPTLQGWPLSGLFCLWLAAHILPFFAVSPGELIAVLNIAFFLALAVSIAKPLILAGNTRNLFVVIIVALLALCNILVHAQLLGVIDTGAHLGIRIAFYVQLLLIIVFAGRVFPMFSSRGVAKPYKPLSNRSLELVAVISFICFAASNLLPVPAWLQALVVIATVIIHSLRVAGWFNLQIFAVPLVWVLHVGYYFLILGMLLTGIADFFPQTRVPGLHALLIGGLGLITIGMMARVSLGHTGRNIKQPPHGLNAIFIAIALAAIIRVGLPLANAQYYLAAIKLSGWMWSVAFLAFTLIYLTYWLTPRVDGKPG
ncbi:MAG: NnrS family protein [Arenicella sp.]